MLQPRKRIKTAKEISEMGSDVGKKMNPYTKKSALQEASERPLKRPLPSKPSSDPYSKPPKMEDKKPMADVKKPTESKEKKSSPKEERKSLRNEIKMQKLKNKLDRAKEGKKKIDLAKAGTAASAAAGGAITIADQLLDLRKKYKGE